MNIPDFPDELASRAQIRADKVGIDLLAYIVRCVDDCVTHEEAADAELDAADAAMLDSEVDLSRCPALAAVKNGPVGGTLHRDTSVRETPEQQVVYIKTYKVEQDTRPVYYSITHETPKEPEPARTMVYQPKSQVQREIKQAQLGIGKG